MHGNTNAALEKENLLVDLLAAVSAILVPVMAKNEQEWKMLTAWAPDFRRHRAVNEQLIENGNSQAEAEIAILQAFIALLKDGQATIDPEGNLTEEARNRLEEIVAPGFTSHFKDDLDILTALRAG